MKNIKLSRLYYWTVVIGLCAYGARAVSLCTKISLEHGVPEFDTLCDLEFCTCRDPFGRVRCLCTGEDPDEEIIVKSKGSCSVPMDATSLSLENCKKVTVVKDGLKEVRSLQTLEFINVTEVSIEDTIFTSGGPSRTIHFVNSTIPDIPSFVFAGNLDSVIFDACRIGVIRSFAFSNIHVADRILFRGTNVINVEAQSFKKFTVSKFLIVDSHFNIIPSRFVTDVMVETIFKIESSYMDAIRTLGFKINNPKKVVVINSMINKLHEEALKIIMKGEVIIENNVLNSIENEAFRGVSLDKYFFLQNGKQKFKFQNQTVTNLETKSLYFNRTAFDVQIGRINVDEVCNCDSLHHWKDILHREKKIVEPLESELQNIWCHLDDTKQGDVDYIQGRHFYQDHCTQLTSGVFFFVIIIAATAVGVLLIVTIIVCVLKRRRNKWKYVPSVAAESQQNDQRIVKDLKKKGKKKQAVHGKPEATKAIIVPDGRTYKETEFHIIVEKAEPLNDDCIPHTIVRDRSRTQVNPPNMA